MAKHIDTMTQMKQALADMRELYDEVATDSFIPKKFRKAPFTKFLRNGYLHYLKKEIDNLAHRVEGHK